MKSLFIYIKVFDKYTLAYLIIITYATLRYSGVNKKIISIKYACVQTTRGVYVFIEQLFLNLKKAKVRDYKNT